MLLGPSSNVGLAEPDGVAVITVMVFCVEELEPDAEFDEAETVIVVLEITITDDTEDRTLDKELDEVPKEDDEDELLDEDDEEDEEELLDEEDDLELEKVLLKVGAIEPEEEGEEELRLLLLLLEVDCDSDVDDVCV